MPGYESPQNSDEDGDEEKEEQERDADLANNIFTSMNISESSTNNGEIS